MLEPFARPLSPQSQQPKHRAMTGTEPLPARQPASLPDPAKQGSRLTQLDQSTFPRSSQPEYRQTPTPPPSLPSRPPKESQTFPRRKRITFVHPVAQWGGEGDDHTCRLPSSILREI